MPGAVERLGANRVRLTVRVTPKGGRDSVDGEMVDADGRAMLKLRVAAPPSDGQANKAMIALLTKALGAPKSAIAITSGETGRVKRVEIAGDADRIIERYRQLLDAS